MSLCNASLICWFVLYHDCRGVLKHSFDVPLHSTMCWIVLSPSHYRALKTYSANWESRIDRDLEIASLSVILLCNPYSCINVSDRSLSCMSPSKVPCTNHHEGDCHQRPSCHLTGYRSTDEDRQYSTLCDCSGSILNNLYYLYYLYCVDSLEMGRRVL